MSKTKFSKVWDGTKANTNALIEMILKSLGEKYEDLSKKEVQALFCEALARSTVQAELFEMAAHIRKRGEVLAHE